MHRVCEGCTEMQPEIQNATLQPDETRIKICVIIQKKRQLSTEGCRFFCIIHCHSGQDFLMNDETVSPMNSE